MRVIINFQISVFRRIKLEFLEGAKNSGAVLRN